MKENIKRALEKSNLGRMLLQIEANDAYGEQVDGITKIMQESGFALKEKKHSELFNAGAYSSVYNQIWAR